MIGAGLPQHVAAAHALEADEHILQRVVKGVPHMERAGDVRRRNDNGEGLGGGTLGPARGKGFRLLPSAIDVAFYSLRLISLLEHGRVGSARKSARVLRCCLQRCQPEARSVRLEPPRIVPELVLERSGQYARHVLVEPTLKHRPEHVLDAVLETLRTGLASRRGGVGLVISTVRTLCWIIELRPGLFARRPRGRRGLPTPIGGLPTPMDVRLRLPDHYLEDHRFLRHHLAFELGEFRLPLRLISCLGHRGRLGHWLRRSRKCRLGLWSERRWLVREYR